MDWDKLGLKRRPWVGLAVVVLVVAAVGLYRALGYAPLVASGKHMEQFCEGLRQDITHDQLRALVDTQGYSSKEAGDAKGAYLRIDDPAALGSYHCEARFKPDGTLASVNFTAKPQ